MNTAALKTFAPSVRNQLLEAVTRKLDFVLTAKTPDFLTTYAPQIASLRKLAEQDRKGLIERVAYTWFNRLTALRFMDTHGWHPFRARVLTPANESETQPELLKLTRTGNLPAELQSHTNPQRLNDLLDGRIPSPDAQGEVYRSLVLAACHFYHALLPNIFEKLDDETELLLPDDLLTEHSVVHGFRTEISDADCSEKDAQGKDRANVEILGWLYQFYISEKKDVVMARKSTVPTEDIPAVTQLFTPHWIVRYLVENSLGRLWLLNRPQSKLRDHMPYYIEGEMEKEFLPITKPEEIKLLDPASGSGHMLSYAFDLLCLIYEEEGYAPSEIPALILKHNLYGSDICPRAAQLAELALVFKAREKFRRFFQPDQIFRPHIIELQHVIFADGELSTYFKTIGIQPSTLHAALIKLLYQFEETNNFGALIQPCLNEQEIQAIRSEIIKRKLKTVDGDLMIASTHQKIVRVLEQAEILTQRYHVVIANPPYMGAAAMNVRLKTFIEKEWEAGKADTYSAFILRNIALVWTGGYVAMITIPNWMFLKSFEALRNVLLADACLSSLVHCGRGVWGSDFGSCAFVIQSNASLTRIGRFKRLFKRSGEVQSNEELERNYFNEQQFPNYSARNSDFKLIPGYPIAYWATERQRRCFASNQPLASLADVVCGMTTGNNASFVRQWFEIEAAKFGRGSQWSNATERSRYKWFPYNKGGEFRKWFGNNWEVVNWENNGRDIIASGRASPRARDKYFQDSVTWSFISSAYFGVRYSDTKAIFDMAGCSAFCTSLDLRFVTALLCANTSHLFLGLVNPTLNFQVGNVGSLPVPTFTDGGISNVTNLAVQAIDLARADWNNFETSWDFRDQPLLRLGLKGPTLEASWRNWEAESIAAIRRMQELERENNQLFIAAYGLDGELKPEVSENQITLARADAKKDMAAFLSYAVGCMMGRYSLDQPGLILADAGDTLKEYLIRVKRPLDKLTFAPDEDGIIPVLDGEWFEDDIVARTRDFLRAIFGEATLRENIRFIEESLGKELRNYFLSDFYKDHLQTYKKRPIYWMVQSPRKGFQCLIYLHRYTKDTMNLALNRYLRDYQAKLRNRLVHVTGLQTTAATAKAKTEARKEVEKLTRVLKECDDWERQTVLPLAQARIELELDDGIKTNYLKLGEALAPIAGLAATDTE